MSENTHSDLWWQAPTTRIGGMTIVLLAVVVLLQVARPTPQGTALIWAGSLLAALPAIMWLAIYYLQKRLETKTKVLAIPVFVLSLLLAAAVGVPLTRDLFRVQDWLGGAPLTEVLGSILVLGFTQEFLKFASVRWSVYPTSAFEERMDGVLYSTVASLGYTTVLNLSYVMDNQGVDLSVGIVKFTITAIAQASFAAVVGYQLGRAKFDGGSIVRLPLGLAVAASLNGLFTYGRHAVNQGLTINVFNALLLALAWGAVTLPVIIYLLGRANRAPVFQIKSSALDRYTSLVLIAIASLALASGWLLKTAVETRVRSFQSNSAGIRFDYPASWVLGTEQDAVAVLTDPQAASAFITRMTVRLQEDAEKDLSALTKERILRLSFQLDNLHVLAIQPDSDDRSVSIRYAYVSDPPADLGPSPVLPVIVEGEDVLTLKNRRLYVFSINADHSLFSPLENKWRTLLGSVRLD